MSNDLLQEGKKTQSTTAPYQRILLYRDLSPHNSKTIYCVEDRKYNIYMLLSDTSLRGYCVFLSGYVLLLFLFNLSLFLGTMIFILQTHGSR